MRAHLRTDRPFNVSGPDRQCQGCGGEAGFFQTMGRYAPTGLPIIVGRWCGACVPLEFVPGRHRDLPRQGAL